MKLINDIRKKLIFFAGDIHKDSNLTGFSWDTHKRLINYNEAMSSIYYTGEGYIGLHRNIGDLSNVAIPGMFKHAWIYTGDNYIVESVSEGVLERNFLHAVMSDYVIILKPLVSVEARLEAVARSQRLADLKMPYDDKFEFDLEVEEILFADKDIALANMKKYGLGTSCSETIALGYVGHRRELALYRVKLGNRLVILPDNFVTTHFEIVWASKFTTPEIVKKCGLHEEGVEMLREFWKDK
jgi:hypothetical protein